MTKKWILKAIVQKIISYLPYPQKINYLFQKHVTKGVNLTDDYFDLKLQHAKDHFDYLMKYDKDNSERVLLELGTGWYPIIPLYYFLMDGGKVISIDIQNWIKKENIIRTIEMFIQWKENGRLRDYLEDHNSANWQKMNQIYSDASSFSLDQIYETFGLSCLIQDARNLDIESDSVDFICSNNTFEHISTNHLKPILAEFIRILKPDGLMSHFIDLSDHFAHFDNSITIYNFLRYSKKRWRLINNSIQHMNRLRFIDYIDLYNDLQIPITEQNTRPGSMKELESIKIHKEFSDYTLDELAVSHGYLVSDFSKSNSPEV